MAPANAAFFTPPVLTLHESAKDTGKAWHMTATDPYGSNYPHQDGMSTPRSHAPSHAAPPAFLPDDDFVPASVTENRGRACNVEETFRYSNIGAAWSRLRTPSPDSGYEWFAGNYDLPAAAFHPHQGRPSAVPIPPPPPKPHEQSRVRTNFHAPRHQKEQVLPPTPARPKAQSDGSSTTQQSERGEASQDQTVVSRGSVGHPFTCNEACKYASKKKGCKDGISCDRCHICLWRRYEPARAAYRAAARSAWVGNEPEQGAL